MLYNLTDITNQLNLNIRGVIHIGGFVGEELASYRQSGLSNTILFEPQKKLYQIIKSKCQMIMGIKITNMQREVPTPPFEVTA